MNPDELARLGAQVRAADHSNLRRLEDSARNVTTPIAIRIPPPLPPTPTPRGTVGARAIESLGSEPLWSPLSAPPSPSPPLVARTQHVVKSPDRARMVAAVLMFAVAAIFVLIVWATH